MATQEINKQRIEGQELDPSMAAAYEKLPPFFKAWVAAAKDQNYPHRDNVIIAVDAYLIARTLKTEQAIIAWEKLPFNEQRQQVPGFNTIHSGNSSGQVVSLAAVYARKGELI